MPNPLLQEAAALCTEAQLVLERHTLYLKKRGAGAAPTAPSGVSPDCIAEEVRKVTAAILQADEKATARKYDEAAALLETAKEQTKLAEDKVSAAQTFGTNRAWFSSSDGLPTTTTFTTDADAVKSDLQKADEAAAKYSLEEYKKAEEFLATAKVKVNALKLKISMHAKTPPTPDKIQELIKAPGGEKMLDDIIANLPLDAPIGVFQEAMKARFNLVDVTVFKDDVKGSTDVALGGAVADDLALRKIYELMAKVPTSHTKENPSFQKITRYAGDSGDTAGKARDKGSYYSSGTKLVVLSCGRGDATSPSVVGSPEQVSTEAAGHIEAGPAPTYFSWTTLHEVAHAVDDKKGFMKKNGSSGDYGGWTSYGKNTLPAAQAAATKFGYDVNYIAKMLSGDSPNPVPLPPLNKTAKDWETARKKVETWAASARSDKNPWKSVATATALALDGNIVHHEAYPNSWVSYHLSSRGKSGVTGYQFRAPGEWFSELYAAYGSKKLKTSHPAYAWLKKLYKDK